MARKNKMGVLKRQRELKKLEKAALKREKREARSSQDKLPTELRVADRKDLEAYGFRESEE